MTGTGSSTISARFANRTNFNIDYYATPNTQIGTRRIQIMNYSNTTTNKTGLVRADRAGGGVDAMTGLWRSNAAITSIKVTHDTAQFAAGTTFSLYGVAAMSSFGAKATGGQIYQDADYYWHLFDSSGTFTPTTTLTNVDYLVIAGGGGSRATIAGGGGAGGYRTTVGTSGGGASAESKITLNSGTAYTISIGAGGSGYSNGNNTSISGTGLTTRESTGGGCGGYRSSPNGIAGGSGGGAGSSEANGAWAGGAGTANQGYAGATGKGGSLSPTGWHMGAGGGGAGGIAPEITATKTPGGPGLISAIDGVARAGGGGGGTQYGDATFGIGGIGGGGRGGAYFLAPTNGAPGTGSGGGGGGYAGVGDTATSLGGSGVVIIRYPKA
jgi:hypothetical protein